ncbi:MAG TPA: hypothetical protein VIW29_07020 [Polyangiaceae bacterium]
MSSLRQSAVALAVLTALGGCRSKSPPARHPVAELTASASAKAEVVELIVPDWQRAERARQLYLAIAALGYEFDEQRARSAARGRSLTAGPAAAATAQRLSAAQLESLLVPPLEASQTTCERYVQLMLEMRTVLTDDELKRLDNVH